MTADRRFVRCHHGSLCRWKEATMGLRTTFFALTYDRQMAKVEAGRAERPTRRTWSAARPGEVLEIGAGTGLNLSLYGPEVDSLTLTEPEPPMLRRLPAPGARQAAHGHGPAGTGRGPALRRRQLRRRRVHAGAVRRERPAPGPARAPPRAAARRRAALHRARALGRRSTRPQAGPHERRATASSSAASATAPTLGVDRSRRFRGRRASSTPRWPRCPAFVSPLVVGTAHAVPGRRYPAETSRSSPVSPEPGRTPAPG